MNRENVVFIVNELLGDSGRCTYFVAQPSLLETERLFREMGLEVLSRGQREDGLYSLEVQRKPISREQLGRRVDLAEYLAGNISTNVTPKVAKQARDIYEQKYGVKK